MKNLPNKITIVRIILVPIIMFFYLAEFLDNGVGKIIALILFVIAALSDMLDGYIARKYNLVSDFGKFLDPIADKILATTGVSLVIIDGTLPNPYGIIFLILMLFRDYVVTGLRQLAQIKGSIIAADMLGKVKSLIIDIQLVIGILLSYFISANNTTDDFLLTFKIVFYVLSAVAAILIIASGINYLVKNSHVLKDKSKTGIVIEKDDSEDVLI